MKVIEHPKTRNPIKLLQEYLAFCAQHPIDYLADDWRGQADLRWQVWLDRNKEYVIEISDLGLTEADTIFQSARAAFDEFARAAVCAAFAMPRDVFGQR
jgi:hypothetical protein